MKEEEEEEEKLAALEPFRYSSRGSKYFALSSRRGIGFSREVAETACRDRSIEINGMKEEYSVLVMVER